MIEYSTPAIPANPQDQAVRLSHEQLWRALVWKAEFPTLFIAPVKQCQILERLPDGFLREIAVHGGPGGTENIQERIFLEPMTRVTFLRLNSSVLGQITNDIGVDAEGELTLRFAFTLALAGAEHGGPEEQAYAQRFSAGYITAVETTLSATRDFVATGVDPTAEIARSRAAAGV